MSLHDPRHDRRLRPPDARRRQRGHGESGCGPERKQTYGLASRKHLASIVASKQVRVEYQKRDRYGRIVGKVLLDGIDACLEQVKAGFAWHYKRYQREQSVEDQRLYAEAENKARYERLGLWRE